ncbi:SCO family protein [Paenibacillus ihbetae]|uniref:Electron transporter SenC n=1 Tax=Paenibacillus ihbetae TaxID=1870820 RepID=A0A1B2E378_9BACL|nr:SCO family protein [Paenibacillus ihbetae]ANY74440.1 electron transporter SenC [Paenibacillus ihbetae]OOC63379.1 SCO family protein [Paenibacillus ihbetae]
MNAFKRYKWTWILLAVCVVAAVYLVYNALGFGKDKLPVIREVGSYSMENVDGKTIASEDTKGKVKLMYFYFTSCPDVCPVTTLILSQIQEQLKKEGLFGGEVNFVSISFDPKTDTKEKIKEFGDRFNADYSGWYFLRGDQEETRKLMQESFKIPLLGNDSTNFTHGNSIALVDRDNNIRKMYNAGIPSDVKTEDIIQDIKTLIKE